MAAADAVFDALSDGTRRGLLSVAGRARPGHGDRAGRRPAGHPPGGEQAPGRPGRRRPGDCRALGARGALPAHARAAVRTPWRGWPTWAPSGTGGWPPCSGSWTAERCPLRRLPGVPARRRRAPGRSGARARLAGRAQPRARAGARARRVHLAGAVPRAAGRSRRVGGDVRRAARRALRPRRRHRVRRRRRRRSCWPRPTGRWRPASSPTAGPGRSAGASRRS